MNKLFKFIVGELLHLANREFRTNAFYLLKDSILTAHGTPAGVDTQHIVKKCYRCENGIFQDVKLEYSSGRGVVWREENKTCYKCNGSGIYDEFWVTLSVYRLGRHEFHKPNPRVRDRRTFIAILESENITPRVHFEGLIRHEPPRFRLGYEAGWWLVLLFNRENMREYWYGMTWISGAFLPLLLVNNLIYFWNRSIMPKIRSARRRLCWHEFDTDAFAFTQYDTCKKCGAERWEVDGDENPIPF